MTGCEPTVPGRRAAAPSWTVFALGLGLLVSSGAAAHAEEPAKGGTLTVARSSDLFTFDPFNTQDDRSIFTELTIYDRLVKLSADGKGVGPELATAWTIAPDGLSADFKLRPDVKFSDGTPLTVDDVVFSLTRAIDQSGSWGFLFSPVKAVRAQDASTVHFEMSEPFAPLLPALSTFAASIYSKANFEKAGDKAGETPLGTGAFAMQSWDRGQQLVLVRNPYYWQAGKPYLDGITLKVVGDDNARALQLASGDVDLVTDIPANLVQQIEGGGGQLHIVSGTAVGQIALNEKVKPFDEVPVRCAMAHAIDRATISQVVYFGKASPARSVLPSATLFYDPDTDPITYDLEAAKALLAKSSVPSGFSFTLTVASGNAARTTIAQIWAAALAQIGITANIEQVEEATSQEMVNTERYTSRLSGWTNDTPDPDEFMGVALDYEPQNGLHSSYRNDEARDLVLAARKELDPAKRQALYSQLQRIVNRDCPFLYSVEEDRIYASRPAVQDFAPNSQGKYSFESVWLKP